ncbi:hypothetical protein CWE04_04965 [Thomasclavelia cocleata]|uniref:Uncharacterized protein n=1 Tax=Thomasclavelia cocleata TaxID=69824 RepID=A0A1I0CMH3_9FIRM|nr:hypothetical protein [Thomasclavelia cocleata]MCR1960779.1 hypothetical protein [Thomasclavelia cocleata]NDO42561.1 hypothetical protein [Thomasclavelia cocleata]PJN81120.1 hypothetical protein CWE04_04965 [Thomasclavelia cocleata]SET20683.1 hypothetical protein SAMN04489758_103122 [Thomasclavelia cocleata]
MENNKLAIVFSNKQCSQKPSYHRTYKDREGKRLKMRLVMLPSELFRPTGTDFGVDSHGINRNERLAYLNVPWDMIKHDKNDDNKRYFYLNRESYNIQFKGRAKEDGSEERIDCLNVTAKELENLFNWSRRKENKQVINERLEKAKKIAKQRSSGNTKTKSRTL